VQGSFLWRSFQKAQAGETRIELAPGKGKKTVVIKAQLGGGAGRLKRARTEAGTLENNDEPASPEVAGPAVAVPPPKPDDSMRANLQCAICCSVFYSPVSLMPCLHSFCAGCYAGWEKAHKDCPTCRQQVKNVQVHHQLMSLAEAYVREHPNEARSAEEQKGLDAQFAPLKMRLLADKSSGLKRSRSSDDEDDEDDEDERRGSGGSFLLGGVLGMLPFGMGMLGAPAGAAALAPPRCRECLAPNPQNGFQCPAQNASHVSCFVCHALVPNRNVETLKCAGCQRACCGQYWNSAACKPHFARVGEFNFPMSGTLLLDNVYETNILIAHLGAKNISLATFIRDELVAKLNAGLTSETFPNATRDTYMCTTCFRKLAGDLCYGYRKAIPAADLPAAVTARPNCHWGHKCRTQSHNQAHAQRFSHICDQTRQA
jgi:E3 ubiquitin-protein ligase CHFR